MSAERARMMRLHLASGAVVAALTIGGYFGGVRPLSRARADQRTFVETLAQRQEALGVSKSELVAARAELTRARDAIGQHDLVLEPASAINTHLARLNAAAERAGVALDETVPSGSEVGTRLVRVPIKMAGRARYPNIAEFLGEVHARFPDTALVGFNITGRPENPDDPAIFSVELWWYAAPESTDSAGGAGAPGSSSTPRG